MPIPASLPDMGVYFLLSGGVAGGAFLAAGLKVAEQQARTEDIQVIRDSILRADEANPCPVLGVDPSFGEKTGVPM